MFLPLLHTNTTDTLLLLERYESPAIWAVVETAAQRPTLSMSAIPDNQDNNSTWPGDTDQMLDDALDPPHEVQADQTSVD